MRKCCDCKWFLGFNNVINGLTRKIEKIGFCGANRTTDITGEVFCENSWCKDVRTKDDCSKYQRKWWKFWVSK